VIFWPGNIRKRQKQFKTRLFGDRNRLYAKKSRLRDHTIDLCAKKGRLQDHAIGLYAKKCRLQRHAIGTPTNKWSIAASRNRPFGGAFAGCGILQSPS
jgi:hypothetical protein